MKESRQKHSKEIEKTRSMGFGGSDAAMAVEIADRLKNNISLTLTQKRRLRIIAGLDMPMPGIENADIIAGRDWEDEMAERLLPNGYNREYLLMWQGEPFKHFCVFAHADFFNPVTLEAVECKWTRTRAVADLIDEYKWQLAQYLMLGCLSVQVAVKAGDIDSVCRWTDIGGYKEQLYAAYRLIDERWDTIDLGIDERDCSQLPPDIAQAVTDMEWLKEEISAGEEKYKEAQAVVRLWMERNDVQKVGGERYTLTYTPATEVVKFDHKALEKTYPKIYEQFKVHSMRAASVAMRKARE